MAQTNTTPAEAKKWAEARSWAAGLKITLSPSTDYLEFYKQYHANKANWDKAFYFMASAGLDTIATGKHVIAGDDVYAMITEGPSKLPENAKWESHRQYIDIQYVIKGSEKIEVTPVSSATVTEPYNEAKDAAHYSANGTYYTATPKEFFLFFPADAHRPNIKTDGFDSVKKLVIKVKYIK